MNSGDNQSRAQAAVWLQKLEIGTVDLEVVIKDWIIQLWSWTLQVRIKIWYSTKTMEVIWQVNLKMQQDKKSMSFMVWALK